MKAGLYRAVAGTAWQSVAAQMASSLRGAVIMLLRLAFHCDVTFLKTGLCLLNTEKFPGCCSRLPLVREST